jgi:tetratricopeptide (TPR) repeat protein
MNPGGYSKLSTALITGISLSLLIQGAAVGAVSAVQPQGKADAKLGKIRSMAETQHEIVMILMRKKEFSKAMAEANKIFEMGWPADQEPLLVKELLGLSGQFMRYQQPEIALELLEHNVKVFEDSKSQVAIYKEMGYAAKEMGRDDEALEYFKKAHQLEKSPPR